MADGAARASARASAHGSGDAAVEVHDLRRTHRGRGGRVVEAVRGVSFEVPRGEVFALLGPNGAGKTSTLEVLEGYTARDSGDVRVLGLDPATDAAALRRRIGIVLQDIAVDPFLTVIEVLRRNAAYYPRPHDPDSLAGMVGLDDVAGARVRTLSGGQKRRLDLALGLIGRPELLFLDEPTTGFDPSARRGAWDLVRTLTSDGTSVLLTTHYMDEAEALAQTVAVMSLGRIVALGGVDELRGSTETRVRFTPPDVALEDLPVRVSIVDGMAEARAEDPVPLLHELTDWSLRTGRPLDRLTVERPSLEDVYLRLTGDTQAVAP